MTIDRRRAQPQKPFDPHAARWRIALPLAGAVLAACGGGGGGPAPIAVALAPRVEAASAGSNVDAANYREYEGLSRYDNGSENAAFGDPLWWTADPGRRVQVGLDFGL